MELHTMETTLFICRRGSERSPAAMKEYPGSDYLPGGWSSLLTRIKDLPSEGQSSHIREVFTGRKPVFIFDSYEHEDANTRAAFALFKEKLTAAGLEEDRGYSVKTSESIMKDIVNEELKRRGK